MYEIPEELLPRMREVVQGIPFLTGREIQTLIECLATTRADYLVHEHLWPDANDDLIVTLKRCLESHLEIDLKAPEMLATDHLYGPI